MNDLDAEWRETTIGETSQCLTGFAFPSAGFSAAGVRLVRGSNVKRAAIDWSPDIAQYWPMRDSSLRAFELKDDDIVVAMDGALVGRSYGRISKADLPAYLVQRVARLRGTSIDQGLLYAWVGSDHFVQYVDSVKTHTAIPHISPRDIRGFPITVPRDLGEQGRIAKTLAAGDKLVAVLERLITKKQAIKQGMMQRLLTGKTRLPGHSKPWSPARLGDLAEIFSGGTPKSTVPAYWDGGIAWCTPTDITREEGRYLRTTERTISAEGLARSAAQMLPKGSLLLCTRATIGDVKMAVGPIATNQGFKSLVPLRGVSGKFLYYKILTLKDELASYGTGSTFLEVSKRDVAGLQFEVPDTDEQRAIATVLGDADDEIDLLGARLKKAQGIKQGIMQELLTGRTRLPVRESAA